MLLLGAGVRAQVNGLEAFKNEIRAAMTASEGGRPADLRAARDHLDAAENHIEAIAEPRQQAQARLFVAVRRADLLFRAPVPNTAKAGELVRAARTAARASGVWQGPYQETGLVLLWQSLRPVEFFALIDDAPEDLALLEGQTPVSSDNAIPLRLLRADLRLVQGREREAIALWTDLSASLRLPDSFLGDAWADTCHGALIWHLLERRENARAELYVPFLRDAQNRRYYTAVLSNQRRDFAATVKLLRGCRDARELLLLGDALEQLGEFDAAIEAYEPVTRDAAADDELRAAASNGLGDCYRRRGHDGDLARAATGYEQSLRGLAGLTSRKVDSELAENYCDLGLLDEQRGDQVAANAWFGRALDALETARAGIPLDPFGATFLEPWFLGSVDGVLRTWRAAGGDPLDALVAIDRVKARSLLDRVASPRALEESPEVLAAVRELALARDPAAVRSARLALERARVTVGERTQLARPRPLDRAALRAELLAEPSACGLAYWLGDSVCWVVCARGGEVTAHELGASSRAGDVLRAAYLAVASAPSEADPWIALDAAAAFFLPEVVTARLRGAARIVFCPDDQLSRLPFEALRVDRASLGLTYDVERAPSLAVRALLRGRAPATGGAVLVDSVPMSAALRTEFALDELRFSAQEGDLVLRAWPDAHRLRGADATLAGLRTRLVDPPRVLHISSHAVTLGAVAWASLLLLADGTVPLSSLADLPLGGSTVVLSACSSATGQALGGEGDAGLLWGPLGAGARSVVASVWQVNQQATCDLMGQMHHALARGESEARALRQARQALAAAPNYAHPHYWAGFAAFAAAANEPRRAAWWQVALLVVGVFAFALIWRRAAR